MVAWWRWSSREIAANRTAIAAMGIENSRPGACGPTRCHRLRLWASPWMMSPVPEGPCERSREFPHPFASHSSLCCRESAKLSGRPNPAKAQSSKSRFTKTS